MGTWEDRKLSTKYSVRMNPDNVGPFEKRPLFADYMAKSAFLMEDKKEILAFLLGSVLNKRIDSEKVIYYKNEIAKDVTNPLAFRTDVALSYERVIYLLEFNGSIKKTDMIRNICYLLNTKYQFFKNKMDRDVTLVNFNNYSNKLNPVLIETYTNNNQESLLYTGNIKIYEVYLTKALEKYYTEGKESLTRFEKMIVSFMLSNYEEAKKIVEGDDLLMIMVDYDFALTHQNLTAEHYKEFEEAASEGEERGIKIGTEQEKLKTAKNMLKKGFDEELVMEITKLSKQEIEKLR